MCAKTTYRTYGAGASSRMATINMLLLWSKSMRFGVVSYFCSIKPT